VMEAPDLKPIREAAKKAKYRELSGGWEAGEFAQRIHPIRKTVGRFVVVRHRLSRKGRPEKHYTRHKTVEDVVAALTSGSGCGAVIVGEHGAGKSFIAQRALEQLPPRDRLILKLFHLDGAGYKEIAGLMGLSMNAVSPALIRARQRIRALLGEAR